MFEGLDRDAFAQAREHEFFQEQLDTMNFTERFQAALAEFDAIGMHAISYVRMLALIRLHAPRNMTFYQELLGVSSAAVTGITDKLVGLDLIERTGLHHDRRAHYLILTEKGQDFLNRILL